MKLLYRILALALLLPSPVLAAFGPSVETETLTARLISATDTTGKGETVSLGLDIQLKNGWKTYWRMPGDAGFPPQLNWDRSDNLKDTVFFFPAPVRFSLLGFDNFGYAKEVVFPIRAQLENPDAALDLRLDAQLLVCSDICIPENISLSLFLPTGAAAPASEATRIQEGIARLPSSGLAESISFGAVRDDGENLIVDVALNQKPGKNADIFVENDAFLSFGAPKNIQDIGNRIYRFTLPLNSLRDDTTPLNTVGLTYVDENVSYEAPVTLNDAPPAQNPILLMIGLALIGGLILNLMPCVLPVLSLKLLSVVSHSGSANKTIRQGFVMAAFGIVFSFLVMATAIAALKTAGATIGWGLQFQHPAFLIFMIVLLLLFAVNLWGLFEIPLPRFIAHMADKTHAHETTRLGHFFTGALAALLATPCTAPFLGTAVGFAMARGTFEIFVIFLALGLGLALPYLLVALVPALARLLPRPGHWMITFKRVLAVALILTAVWLGSVLLTLYQSKTPVTKDSWVTFKETAIAQYVADNRIVFVDVTADWCLTCKANKKFVLESKEISSLFKTLDAVLMRADWTKPDPVISAYLEGFGRFGIPFNVVYGPGAPNGIVLPELLTTKAVKDALNAAQ